MPEIKYPNQYNQIELDAPWTPFKFEGQIISDDYAAKLVDSTLWRLESWRQQNCDSRWKLNDWLYYGYVPPRVWEGTSIPRSAVPIPLAFSQIESANATLYRELLSSDEVFGVSPEGDTHPLEAQQIRDRLLYIMDHNIDDYGWTARLELKLTLKDLLIYGNCFALVEYDDQRKQATCLRIDPRDVFVDPGCNSPYIERARAVVLRKPTTIDEVEAMRGIPKYRIPSKEILYGISQNRSVAVGDTAKSMQEAARGNRYQPIADDVLPMPSSRFLDLYIYMGGGREIWMVGRGNGTSAIIYNEPYPYGCMRLVSAPCFTVPNRFYAQSFVDIIDPFQQITTTLVNRHLDEISLRLNPPKNAKRGVIRTPSSMSYRPGAVIESANPKEDLIYNAPNGVLDNIGDLVSFFKGMSEEATGRSPLATSGQPGHSNADRTRGGMQMQMQAPMERLAEIADNYENYALVPLLYKMLRVEKMHAEGVTYGRSSVR